MTPRAQRIGAYCSILKTRPTLQHADRILLSALLLEKECLHTHQFQGFCCAPVTAYMVLKYSASCSICFSWQAMCIIFIFRKTILPMLGGSQTAQLGPRALPGNFKVNLHPTYNSRVRAEPCALNTRLIWDACGGRLVG